MVAKIRKYITEDEHASAEVVLDKLRALMFGLTRR
jgi:hypothetical protein